MCIGLCFGIAISQSTDNSGLALAETIMWMVAFGLIWKGMES